MSVNLKITLGTVSYTDWIHVTASKVSAPAIVVYEVYIDVPVTNYNFVIPNLDPENYYVRYYDAATNTSLGTLRAELIVNALTSEFVYERRFYTCGGSSPGDPAKGSSYIVDPYLQYKNVTGVFKEGFRYFKPVTEYDFNATTYTVSILNGTTFDTGEIVSVDIQYSVASTSAAGNGLYTGNLDITTATRTLLGAEANSRLRLVGTGSKQVITLCALSSIGTDNGFYFDNSVGGMAVQVKILTNGTDLIRYNGLTMSGNDFQEFWVDQGGHLLIRKFDDNYWEVIGDYHGANVGQKVTVTCSAHPNIIPEDGREIDGDEYGKLWWWINYVLPPSHYISDDSGTIVAPRIGQFIIKPATKKIIMPNSQGLSEKGLKDFIIYGTDTANRPYDYPGGFQDQMILQHQHRVNTTGDQAGVDPGKSLQRADNTGDGYATSGVGVSTNGPYIEAVGGIENRVKNVGVIYGRRI